MVTLPHFLRISAVAETLAQSCFRDLVQILILRFPGGRLVVRILGRGIELESATLRNRKCVVTRLRKVREERAHLSRRFEIDLRHITQPALVRDVGAGADADHHIVRRVILASQKVHVIRRDQTQPEILCEPRKNGVHLAL